ncbi:MAG: helix-turn-helix domain-containing protein [Thermomicrobiales bacterium]
MTDDATSSIPDAPFAAVLRQHRRAAGLTQRDLAARSGISERAISDLERGVNRHPQRETARMVSEALGLHGAAQAAFLEVARRLPVAPAPAADAPPPSPAPGYDPLIGRDRELALIVQTLLAPTARLVTLTGPGGVGKTRLAGEIAARLRHRHPAGIPVLRLDGVHDAALVMPSLALALDEPATGDAASLAARIAARISADGRLVILDNLEHLLEAAPDLGEVARRLTTGSLLVTSRETLRVRAEQVIPIRPLPPPDALAWQEPTPASELDNPAMQLFVRRALAQRPDLAISAGSPAGRANLAAIADICQRLDGLPLAIELAAAQIPLFSPPAIGAMLDQAGLPLLAGGPRDHPARLQTMDASIAWSYGRLNAPEQRAFRTLSVFAGGCSLDAAAALLAPDDNGGSPGMTPLAPAAGIDPAALALLGSLTRIHLLMPDDEAPAHAGPRFRMLEPIRLFALGRLQAAGEEPRARLRHARYFTELAAILDPLTIGDQKTRRLQQQTLELDNFRAALDWALAAGEGDLVVGATGNVAQIWKLRGLLPEARQRIAAALKVDGASSVTDRWFLRFWAVTFAIEAGDHEDALALAHDLRRIGEAAGDPLGEGVGYAMLSRALGAFPGRTADAAAAAQRAVDLLEPLGRAEWTGLAWLRLGVERHRAGQLPAARDALLHALALRRAEPFAGVEAAALISLGAVWFDLGDARQALDAYREALHLALQEEHQAAVLGALLGLADVALHAADAPPERRMTTALQLAAAAEWRRVRYGLGRGAISGVIARWVAPLRESLGDEAVDAALAPDAGPDMAEIAELVVRLRVPPGAAPLAPPVVTLIGGFGSLQ